MSHPSQTAYGGIPRRSARPPHAQSTRLGGVSWLPQVKTRCAGCFDTGLRNVYGAKGRFARGDERPTDPVLLFAMPCTCHAGLLVRVRAGLRALDVEPRTPAGRAADVRAEQAAAAAAAVAPAPVAPLPLPADWGRTPAAV